jgi:divalent metal cation (Fe/Co/Zn/Cd) transporter
MLSDVLVSTFLLASVFIASIIALSGIYLPRDNVYYLVGRSPGKEFMDRIESTARSVGCVLGVHDLRAEYIGPNVVHTGFHIVVARGTSVERADMIAEEVEERASRERGRRRRVIHIDPAES